jgi:hypothetical protein
MLKRKVYKEFQEGRSIVGKRYLQAQQLTKPQMAKSMMEQKLLLIGNPAFG